MRYRVSRINTNVSLFSEKLDISAALSKDIVIEDNGFKWRFLTSPAEIYNGFGFGQSTLIFGEMVRYRDQEEDVIDELMKRIKKQVVEGRVFGSCKFVILIEKKYIAYSSDVNRISDGQFKRIFSSLLWKATSPEPVYVELQPIINRYDFIKDLKSMEQVREIEYTLHPSNPSYRERWREVDEELQSQNIQTEKARLKPRPNGSIRLSEGSSLFRKMLMVSDGYGEASAVGIVKGVIKKVHSKLRQMTFDVKRNTTEQEIGRVVMSNFENIDRALSKD